MKISGWQKITLLDYPGKVASTIFTCGCDFRCPFCHNPDLVTRTAQAPTIAETEIFEFLQKRRGKLDGVCVTGGEPLLQADITNFIKKIKELGFLVKLDTNGSFPEKLKELVNTGLVDYVAIDIKNCKEKYAQTVGLCKVEIKKIEESVNFLMQGKLPYEFRTTVVREFHTLDDLKKITHWIGEARAYFLQSFVDSGDLVQNGLHGYTEEEMREFCSALKDRCKKIEVRGITEA